MPSNISLPNTRDYEYGYELAYKLVCEKLAGIDIEKQCLKSGSSYQVIGSKKAVILDFLGQPYQVILPDVRISMKGDTAEVRPRDKILILHYFTQATGVPLSAKLISFKELPEGLNYFPTFFKRTIKPLMDNFGKEPQRLLDIAGDFGGHKADFGDAAVTIYAFKLLPITIVLWRGDDEFPPDGSILFDSTVSDYLTAEDIIVLCETITWRLVRAYRQR